MNLSNLLKENDSMLVGYRDLRKNHSLIHSIKGALIIEAIIVNTTDKKIRKYFNNDLIKNIKIDFKKYLRIEEFLKSKDLKTILDKLSLSLEKDIMDDNILSGDKDFLTITDNTNVDLIHSPINAKNIICRYTLKKARIKVIDMFLNRKLTIKNLHLFLSLEAIFGGILINFIAKKLTDKGYISSGSDNFNPKMSFSFINKKVLINGIKNELGKTITIPVRDGKTIIGLNCMGKQGDTAIIPDDISCTKENIDDNVSSLSRFGEVKSIISKSLLYLNKGVLDEQKGQA